VSFIYNHTNCKSVSVHASTWIKIVSSVNAADVIVSPSGDVKSLGIQSLENTNRHSANMSEFCDAITGDVARLSALQTTHFEWQLSSSLSLIVDAAE
jgi:hypothetical protein